MLRFYGGDGTVVLREYGGDRECSGSMVGIVVLRFYGGDSSAQVLLWWG